jgi:hypothetical protein
MCYLSFVKQQEPFLVRQLFFATFLRDSDNLGLQSRSLPPLSKPRVPVKWMIFLVSFRNGLYATDFFFLMCGRFLDLLLV